MPATATDLHALQDIDVALDERQLARRQIDLRLAGSADLQEARAVARESEARLRDLDTRQREAERAVEPLRAKLDAEQRRLYGGSITSPKEAAAIQHEIEALQQVLSGREDALLALMAEVETAGDRHAVAVRRLRELQAERTAEVAQLEGQRAEGDKAIAELEARRSDITKRIPPQIRDLYDGLRQRRQGRAVARIERNACSGCRIALPVDTMSKVRSASDTLVQCPSCERILAGV